MRDIKFRALKSGCWHYLILKHPAAIANALLKQWESGEEVVFETPWSQYTGLKDKQGKEIYEGDILAQRKHFIQGKQTQFGQVAVKFGEYDDSGIEFGSPGIGWYVDGYSGYIREDGREDRYSVEQESLVEYLNYEVIGNICQNPELLEGENG